MYLITHQIKFRTELMATAWKVGRPDPDVDVIVYPFQVFTKALPPQLYMPVSHTHTHIISCEEKWEGARLTKSS